MWRDFPFVVALAAVCASIASFIALMEISSPGQGVIALEHVSFVLVPLSIALALAVERRPTTGAWQAQVAAAAISLAFVIVALVKLYSTSSTTGASFQKTRIGFVAAVCVTVGCTGYAISLQPDTKAFIWYLAAGAAAALAGSAAARMHRR